MLSRPSNHYPSVVETWSYGRYVRARVYFVLYGYQLFRKKATLTFDWNLFHLWILLVFHDIDINNLCGTNWSLIDANLIRTIDIENFISFSRHHSNLLYEWFSFNSELLLNLSSFLSFFISFLFQIDGAKGNRILSDPEVKEAIGKRRQASDDFVLLQESFTCNKELLHAKINGA